MPCRPLSSPQTRCPRQPPPENPRHPRTIVLAVPPTTDDGGTRFAPELRGLARCLGLSPRFIREDEKQGDFRNTRIKALEGIKFTGVHDKMGGQAKTRGQSICGEVAETGDSSGHPRGQAGWRERPPFPPPKHTRAGVATPPPLLPSPFSAGGEAAALSHPGEC
jgi:hypothetical protein